MDSKRLALFQHTPARQFLGLQMQLGREIGAGIIGKDEVMGLVMAGFVVDDGETTFHHG